jgi:hypothetical protein
MLAMQFIYIWYDRKQNKIREDKLRRETREIQDQMEKIFSALRDEIYDQVNLITKRPRLSKKEKEAVEGLNQALEVSETLIEKEINDVKTILEVNHLAKNPHKSDNNAPDFADGRVILYVTQKIFLGVRVVSHVIPKLNRYSLRVLLVFLCISGYFCVLVY